MKVALTDSARADLAEIYAHYAERSGAAADKVIGTIFRAINGLATFPLMGRRGDVPETRERFVMRYPYRIVYHIDQHEEVADIWRVIHRRPELRELANHLRQSKQITILRDAGEKIATIVPANPVKRRPSSRRPRSLRPDDSLWKIVGIDKSPDSPTDVSSNKHKYLAEAYLHEPK